MLFIIFQMANVKDIHFHQMDCNCHVSPLLGSSPGVCCPQCCEHFTYYRRLHGCNINIVSSNIIVKVITFCHNSHVTHVTHCIIVNCYHNCHILCIYLQLSLFRWMHYIYILYSGLFVLIFIYCICWQSRFFLLEVMVLHFY